MPKLYLHDVIIKWLWFKGCCWKYLPSAVDWFGVYQITCTRLILGMTSYWILRAQCNPVVQHGSFQLSKYSTDIPECFISRIHTSPPATSGKQQLTDFRVWLAALEEGEESLLCQISVARFDPQKYRLLEWWPTSNKETNTTSLPFPRENILNFSLGRKAKHPSFESRIVHLQIILTGESFCRQYSFEHPPFWPCILPFLSSVLNPELPLSWDRQQNIPQAQWGVHKAYNNEL